MRLICPNCGAQYEVADDMIPPEGRDVQCSNCGHTWMEHPGASVEAEETGQEVAPTPAPSVETAPEPVAEPDTPVADASPDQSDLPAEPEPAESLEPVEAPVEAEDETASDDASEPEPEPATEPEASEDEDATDDAIPSSPVAALAARRGVDPGVAEILREEAAREKAARAAESATSFESQPDLGITEPKSPEAQRRTESHVNKARLRGEPTESAPMRTAPSQSESRSNLLPDIEEINSTLRSSAERGPEEATIEEVAEARNKSGFRRGFTIVLIVAFIALLIYIYAPQIITMAPGTEPALTGYVDAVDNVRLWLDLKMQGVLSSAEPDPAAISSDG